MIKIKRPVLVRVCLCVCVAVVFGSNSLRWTDAKRVVKRTEEEYTRGLRMSPYLYGPRSGGVTDGRLGGTDSVDRFTVGPRPWTAPRSQAPSGLTNSTSFSSRLSLSLSRSTATIPCHATMMIAYNACSTYPFYPFSPHKEPPTAILLHFRQLYHGG